MIIHRCSQDGLAEICLDEDSLPAIKPTIYGMDGSMEGRERELQNKPRHQVVNTITMEKWKEITAAFQVKKPRIEPRDDRSKDDRGNKGGGKGKGDGQ